MYGVATQSFSGEVSWVLAGIESRTSYIQYTYSPPLESEAYSRRSLRRRIQKKVNGVAQRALGLVRDAAAAAAVFEAPRLFPDTKLPAISATLSAEPCMGV